MTDRRGRSGRKAIVSDATLAAEDASVVGARVQEHFVGRAERGEHFPDRSTPAVPAQPATPEAQVELLRAEVETALTATAARLAQVSEQADLAARRATLVMAAAQALTAELARLSSVLPPDVATELDGAVERFGARLQSA